MARIVNSGSIALRVMYLATVSGRSPRNSAARMKSSPRTEITLAFVVSIQAPSIDST